MASFNIPEDELIDSNIYIVSMIGWEYNDEYYYRPESRGGNPINSFTIPALADEYCKTKNCEWFIKGINGGDNPGYYIDSWSIDNDQINKLIKDIPGLTWDDYAFRCKDTSSLKYDQIWPLMEELDLFQYEVIPVKLTA